MCFFDVRVFLISIIVTAKSSCLNFRVKVMNETALTAQMFICSFITENFLNSNRSDRSASLLRPG